ncbi:phage major capsid protein, P2 family [Gilliamella sp. Pra-s65]|uniref:phage major capsid protein, P2 family n=1 Tax=unclassified Gilliamella TaxID=2685620 RepID=UPI001365FC6F|nr:MULTISPECIES: phage major capsid protein, P2 family [unclassified Gilliamella]MWN89875.1 phage major capsid protein, P2 family [Gilliamella sp. Pra-s65]MWP73047.1 phage major capsid protein, P2 family [Gilliamella sp. Pra-s52]
MRNETRKLFNGFKHRIAQLNGIDDASESFAVNPEVNQTLEKRTQQSSEFLSKINFEFVDAQEGEKVGVGVTGTTASTTDTTAQEREAVDISDLNQFSYRCEQTNYDTSIRYAKLDAWRHKKNFQTLLRDALIKQKALDRIMIGFNGTHRAPTSNKTTYPLLQDVNKGWLQHYREDAPERVMNEGTVTPGKIIIASNGGDYKNLDALVYDAVENLIDPVYSEDTDLVVICGRGLLHDKYFPIANEADKNTEKVAGQILLAKKSIGELPAYRVPYFPKGAMLITSFSNLAIYIQNETARRQIIDNPKRDRIEDFQSANEAFVVERYDAGCLIENIEVR